MKVINGITRFCQILNHPIVDQLAQCLDGDNFVCSLAATCADLISQKPINKNDRIYNHAGEVYVLVDLDLGQELVDGGPVVVERGRLQDDARRAHCNIHRWISKFLSFRISLPRTARVKIQRNMRSMTMATNFQSSLTFSAASSSILISAR